MKRFAVPIVIAIAVAVVFAEDILERVGIGAFAEAVDMGPVDWSAVSAWPAQDKNVAVEAVPNPRARTTVIVLDDSSSMGSQIDPAKEAIVRSLEFFGPDDRVGLLTLNRGVLLDVTDIETARAEIARILAPVISDGSTPLTEALSQGRAMLEAEGRRARGFGSYRLLVATDGEANEPESLFQEVADTVTRTPIQIFTIGIGIGRRHTLNAPGYVGFVSVKNISGLQAALESAIAEQTSFDPVTSFDEGKL